MKKVLAVVLCVITVLSVMVAVAYATNQNTNTAVTYQDDEQEEASNTTTPTEQPKEDEEESDDFFARLDIWWQSFKPLFTAIYQMSFVGFSQALAAIVSAFLNIFIGGDGISW
ncbi:MAG: hypothetical protein LBB67_05405 [Oscillospiraceae bacterium]|nr:hypothetical protein [Oscillospiraceae bacterium]